MGRRRPKLLTCTQLSLSPSFPLSFPLSPFRLRLLTFDRFWGTLGFWQLVIQTLLRRSLRNWTDSKSNYNVCVLCVRERTNRERERERENRPELGRRAWHSLRRCIIFTRRIHRRVIPISVTGRGSKLYNKPMENSGPFRATVISNLEKIATLKPWPIMRLEISFAYLKRTTKLIIEIKY